MANRIIERKERKETGRMEGGCRDKFSGSIILHLTVPSRAQAISLTLHHNYCTKKSCIFGFVSCVLAFFIFVFIMIIFF